MKNSKLRWAVLGTGRFVTTVALPAMKQCQQAQVIGIASRSAQAAESAAKQLGLPKSYASYEAALQDPEVDVIYNALPNHLHVEWSIRAMQAGKHVLCEKPISLTLEGCRRLMEARDQARVADLPRVCRPIFATGHRQEKSFLRRRSSRDGPSSFSVGASSPRLFRPEW